MAFSIADERTDQLARRYASLKRTTLTGAVRAALEEAIAREQQPDAGEAFVANLRRVQERVKAIPILDPRSPDEILGYDEHGLPT